MLNFCHKFNSQKGFTLVEIMITLALIVTISTIGYVSYNQISGNTKFNNAYADLANALFEAKQSALSQIDTSSYCANNSLNIIGYQVEVKTEENKYELDMVCGSDSDDSATWIYSNIKTVTLDDSLGISYTPDNSPVLFKVPNALVDVEHNIDLYNDSDSKTITVATTGAIFQ